MAFVNYIYITFPAYLLLQANETPNHNQVP